MKMVSSRNTWYLIFSIVFIVMITILAFRFIFKRTEEKLSALAPKQQESQIAQVSKTTPTPTPSSSPKNLKPFFNIIDVEKSQEEKKETEENTNTEVATKSSTLATVVIEKNEEQPTKEKDSDLEIITGEDGTTYVGTKNSDGSEDKISTKATSDSSKEKRTLGALIISDIVLPEGYATDPVSLINRILNVVLVVSALLVFAYLIWGGFDWITSGGDKAKVDGARSKIVAALVGLIIVASSFAILQLTLNFLGISSLNELLSQSFPVVETEAIQVDENTATASGQTTKGGK